MSLATDQRKPIERIEDPRSDRRRDEPEPTSMSELFDANPECAADIVIAEVSDGNTWKTVQALRVARRHGSLEASELLGAMEKKAEMVQR